MVVPLKALERCNEIEEMVNTKSLKSNERTAVEEAVGSTMAELFKETPKNLAGMKETLAKQEEEVGKLLNFIAKHRSFMSAVELAEDKAGYVPKWNELAVKFDENKKRDREEAAEVTKKEFQRVVSMVQNQGKEKTLTHHGEHMETLASTHVAWAMPTKNTHHLEA